MRLPQRPTGLLHRAHLWAEMIKLSHSVFALPFAVMAAVLAWSQADGVLRPRWPQLGLIIICMVAARSSAMTFNRMVDAAIDARNPRTANRAIPTGSLSTAAAGAFLALSIVTFGAGCLGFHLFYANPWPIVLAGPVLLYLCGYSLAKRFTSMSHLWLGSAIAMSPPSAWLAIDPASLGRTAVLLAAAVTFWIAGFDIIYACQDVDVDRREGLHSIPARLGTAWALRIARLFHVLAVLLLVAVAYTASLGWLYGVGVVLTGCLLWIENSLVRPDDLSKVNLAFFTINGVVSVGLCLFTVADRLCGLPPVLGASS